MKIKVLYILSNIANAQAFIWIAKGLDKEKFDLQFLFLNPDFVTMEQEIRDLGIPVFRIQLSGKKDYPKAWLKCFGLMKSIKPDIVHCHLFDANLIGLSAGKIAGVNRRIYTRHHGDLHHMSFKRGVWFDKLVNSLSTDVIAPSEIAKKVLVEMDGIESEKVKMIYHGFDFSEFTDVSMERIQGVQKKYKIPENGGPVIGVIARWTEWKGVHITINAFKQFLDKHPNAILVLANSGGDFEKHIYELLDNLPDYNYRLIDFEKDVAALYKTFNVFVHIPIRETAEAFGQTYIEALLSGVPSIFTKSGVAVELDAILDLDFVEYEDTEAILKKLEGISNSSCPSININGRLSEFSSEVMINKLEQQYLV